MASVQMDSPKKFKAVEATEEESNQAKQIVQVQVDQQQVSPYICPFLIIDYSKEMLIFVFLISTVRAE